MGFPLPYDRTTPNGKLASKIERASTDEEYATLEAELRAYHAAHPGSYDYESFVRHLVVLANDAMGLGHEQWRKTKMFNLHASGIPPMSPRKRAKLEKKWRKKGLPV